MPLLRPVVLTQGRVRAARALALVADFVQIVGFPVFGEGFASPWNDALDFLVGGALTWLVGWHWAFLPSFVAEIVPVVDLIPTWTAAVLFATRKGAPPPAAPPPPATPIEPGH